MHSQENPTTTTDNRADFTAKIPLGGIPCPIIIREQKFRHRLWRRQTLPNPRLIDDAIYIEDTAAKAIQKLLNLQECNFKERLAYVKHLGELISLFDEEGVQKIGIILKIILKDSDDIKKCLITQLPSICDFLEHRSDGNKRIKDFIVPALQSLLECSNTEVQKFYQTIIQIKQEAGKEVVRVSRYLNEDELGSYILTKVINMAHDEVNEDNKFVAVQLLGKLSETFGQALTESFIAFEILSMGEDPKYSIRKEAVLQLANVGRVVTSTFFKVRLLPFFIKYYLNFIQLKIRKCEEKTWQTRLSCVDVIVDISNICTVTQRDNEIVQRMLAFLNDSNRQVKINAYKKLGMFISTLQKSTNLNDKLFEHYLKMTDSEIRDLEADKEILQLCAFNFPGVLFIYGRGKWPQMQKLFQQLFKNSDKRIKKPLACCLHEIAEILGAEMAEKELISVLDQVLKDTSDDIKYSTIANLWKFLRVFETERQEQLLDVFVLLQKDQNKWRVRELIAKQLHELAKIFNPETVFKIIVPISVKLCNDIVSCVRKQAAKRIYGLVEALGAPGFELFQSCLIENIKGFAESNRFNQRQTFVTICQNLMSLESGIFERELLEQFIILSKDKVKNVRLLVAKVIQKHFQKNGRLSNHQALLDIVEHFKTDNYITNSLNFQFRRSISPTSPTKTTDSPSPINTIVVERIISDPIEQQELPKQELPQQELQQQELPLQELQQQELPLQEQTQQEQELPKIDQEQPQQEQVYEQRLKEQHLSEEQGQQTQDKQLNHIERAPTEEELLQDKSQDRQSDEAQNFQQ